jgi:hypothetical protein
MRYVHRAGVEAAAMQDQTVLYDVQSKRFCVLNDTAAFLWRQLSEGKTADELSGSLMQTFDGVDEGTARSDVEDALAELVKLDLVQTAN